MPSVGIGELEGLDEVPLGEEDPPPVVVVVEADPPPPPQADRVANSARMGRVSNLTAVARKPRSDIMESPAMNRGQDCRAQRVWIAVLGGRRNCIERCSGGRSVLTFQLANVTG